MAKSILQKHYQRILSQWPVDILRPDISFQSAMQRRINHRLGAIPQSTFKSTPVPTSTSTSNTTSAKTTSIPGSAPASASTSSAAPQSSFNEASELEQINVLYSLLQNRYAKMYPLSDSIMKPASNPTYYEDLRKELDEAPRRGRWEAMLNRWKGFLRFS